MGGHDVHMLSQSSLVSTNYLVHYGDIASVGVHEAKTNLSMLLRRVAAGEEIVITRSGEPVAKLVPVRLIAKRRFGTDAGRFEVPEDFNEPLPDDVLKAFES